MKKNLIFISSLAFFAFLFISCGSTKISLKNSSPAAIISVIGNSQIPWVDSEAEETATGEPETEGLLTSMVNRATDAQNPELLTAVDRLDYAYDSAALLIPEITGCQILSKEELTSSEAYTYLSPTYFNMLSPTKTATDLKDLSVIGAKNARYLMDSTGTKSLISFSFTFQKDLVSGSKSNGMLGGLVTLKAKFLNDRGSEVLNRIYAAKTSEPVKILRSQYNKDLLLESFNDAIDSTIRQFCVDLINLSSDEESVAGNSEDAELEQAQAIPLPVLKQ